MLSLSEYPVSPPISYTKPRRNGPQGPFQCSQEKRLSPLPCLHTAWARVVFRVPIRLFDWTYEENNPPADMELKSHGGRLLSRASTKCIAYGNEPTAEYIYGDACFIIEIDDLQGRPLSEA
jgi:hypothetical protein